MTLTGERLGWTIYQSDRTYTRIHRVQVDEFQGPVIVIAGQAIEVGEEWQVFTTREEAEAILGLTSED